MANITLKNNRHIMDYGKPYIVAEVNSSHNGSVEQAKRMIDEIKKAGCDCVKFQSWSAESLYSKSYYDQNPIAKRIVKKFALSEDELLELCRYCQEVQIDFSSTPYSKREVDFLVDACHAPFVKVSSMDITNDLLLKYVASKGVPIILSTGMAELEEIEHAIMIIEETGNSQICILHCISIYPAQKDTIHLNNIIGLRERFPQYPIGFSDHSLGVELACASVALGAAVIEKHFTLDKTKMGMDNNMAIEPDEMASLVELCGNVYHAMGQKERLVSNQELEQRLKMRRSIVTSRKLEKDTIICMEDLDLKRPGTGIAPECISDLIGRRILHDVDEDVILKKEDFV